MGDAQDIRNAGDAVGAGARVVGGLLGLGKKKDKGHDGDRDDGKGAKPDQFTPIGTETGGTVLAATADTNKGKITARVSPDGASMEAFIDKNRDGTPETKVAAANDTLTVTNVGTGKATVTPNSPLARALEGVGALAIGDKKFDTREAGIVADIADAAQPTPAVVKPAGKQR